jgi:four helix bundle protein
MSAALEPFHQRGFRFGCHIVRLYLKLGTLPRLPPYLARQVLQSGTSIGANLEEAKAAQTRRDSAAKFSIALKEARETAYWLRLLVTTGLAPDSLVASALDEADELIAILTVARRKLNAPGPGTKGPIDGRQG